MRTFEDKYRQKFAWIASGIFAFSVLLWAVYDELYYATVTHFQVAVFVPAFLIAVLLFVAAVSFQRSRISTIDEEARKREELFCLIGENAADMIAVVDVDGHRLYNSPAFKNILGYSPEELGAQRAFEQIHPEDRQRVKEAADLARVSGKGQRVEYRVRHRNGTWLVFESTANTVKNDSGSVEKLVIVNRDVTERKLIEKRLQYNALHDSLTNLPNRTLFFEQLNRALAHQRQHPQYRAAVLFLDFDGFKVFNDAMGHLGGDQLIMDIASRLTDCLRRTAVSLLPPAELQGGEVILGRLGGDEFAILIPGVQNPQDAVEVGKELQKAIAPAFAVGRRTMSTSASIGIAVSQGDESAEELMRDANIAMYRAKALGKDRLQLFDDRLHVQMLSRLKLETDLRKAIYEQEFLLHFQPIVRLDTGTLSGFEALVRWQHPEAGLLSPYKFVTIAEETGLIIPIGNWVLREACKEAQRWTKKFPQHAGLSITVNVSAGQFNDDHLVADVHAALQESCIAPGRLQLEITENMTMADPDRADHVLTQLRKLGVTISIDDFGTGHSSLSRLRTLPADVLKIDRCFVNTMETSPDNHELIRLMVTLARAFNLKVIAEGSENALQVQQLKELGCEFAQGYFFAKPIPPDELDRLLSLAAIDWQIPAAPRAESAATGHAAGVV